MKSEKTSTKKNMSTHGVREVAYVKHMLGKHGRSENGGGRVVSFGSLHGEHSMSWKRRPRWSALLPVEEEHNKNPVHANKNRVVYKVGIRERCLKQIVVLCDELC